MTETRAWDGETVSAICGQLASRMRSRVSAIEERDGENAVTGPGVGIGYRFAREIAHALEQASQFAEPPTAPCADEVEVVARAIGEAFKQPFINDGTQLAAQAALAALSPLRQAERERAAEDERALIVRGLEEEADATPCEEDAVVVRDCAWLVRADFSYEEAERLKIAAERAVPVPTAQPPHKPKPDAQWLAGAEATRSALAGYAEARGARALAEAMRAFPLPPMGGADAK